MVDSGVGAQVFMRQIGVRDALMSRKITLSAKISFYAKARQVFSAAGDVERQSHR